MRSIYLTSLAIVVGVSADHYTFEWGPQAGNAFPFASVQRSDDGRFLQTTNAPDCEPIANRFKCTSSTTLKENADDGVSNSSATTLTIYTECDYNAEIKFDFRQATGCTCEAHVHRVLQNGTATPDKYCPCSICSEGFGNAPVAIDCTGWDNVTATTVNQSWASNTVTQQSVEEHVDSLIIGYCSSLDCGMSCNGTCRLDCANSDSSCKFCSNNPANIPNATAPNRTDDPLTNFDGKAADAGNSGTISQTGGLYLLLSTPIIGMIMSLL